MYNLIIHKTEVAENPKKSRPNLIIKIMKTKKIVTTFIVVLISSFCSSTFASHWYVARGQNKLDIQTSVNIGSIWADKWLDDCRVVSQYDGSTLILSIYAKNANPWDYLAKVTIPNIPVPDKKEQKSRIKSQQQYQYECKVEFFYSVEYPSVEECLAKYNNFMVPINSDASKRVVEGKAYINPEFFIGANTDKTNHWMYRQVIAIWFDEVGYQISFDDRLFF